MSNHEQNLMLAAAAPKGATVTLKRTLCVHISGSPSNLSLAGPLAGMWKAAPGKETEIFSPMQNTEGDHGDMVNSIRNGVVRRVSVEGYTSTFPFTLGVTMSCVRPMEMTELGERFAYTVLPQSSSTTPMSVFLSDPAQQQDEVWRTSYSKWNKTNLESEGVMDTTNQPYVFVHMSHPAIGILKYNAPMIGCDIEKQPKFDGQYYKITRQVMATCCQALRSQVLGGMDTDDLNQFILQVHRVNAPGWDHLDNVACMQDFTPKAKWTPEELAQQKQHHLLGVMTKEYQYIARLQIEYEVPSPALAA
jgi:hypothetical protein